MADSKIVVYIFIYIFLLSSNTYKFNFEVVIILNFKNEQTHLQPITSFIDFKCDFGQSVL